MGLCRVIAFKGVQFECVQHADSGGDRNRKPHTGKPERGRFPAGVFLNTDRVHQSYTGRLVKPHRIAFKHKGIDRIGRIVIIDPVNLGHNRFLQQFLLCRFGSDIFQVPRLDILLMRRIDHLHVAYNDSPSGEYLLSIFNFIILFHNPCDLKKFCLSVVVNTLYSKCIACMMPFQYSPIPEAILFAPSNTVSLVAEEGSEMLEELTADVASELVTILLYVNREPVKIRTIPLLTPCTLSVKTPVGA
nr:MAG TPA_asm: hypothetical protein [Bacteriophage sp.]